MNSAYRPLSPIKRAALIGVGTTTLGVGIAGMFLPGLPTTVFILITLACYTRSSERLYNWVLTRTWLQGPLKTAFAYKERGTISVRIKLIAQAVAWSSVLLTVFGGTKLWAQLLTLAFAASCSIAMGLIKTDERDVTLRSWRMNLSDIGRQLVIGAASGALAGLMWGLGGRIIMRFVANVAEKAPQFNLQPTVMMLVGTTVLGLLIGLAYAVIRRALSTNKWTNGALFGLLVMFTLGAALYLTPYMQADIARVGLEWRELIVVLFVPNFIVFGVVMSLAFRSLERKALATS